MHYRRDDLLVTNTGPRGEGYTYCTLCGMIEPTASAAGNATGTHPKPYPDDREPNCPGSASTRGLVLGTTFISDVLLVRLKVEAPATLQPQFLATHMALRSVAEALTIAAAHHLDIEATELQAEYRPALTPHGNAGLEAEIYLYDTLAGGAGFTRRIHEARPEGLRAGPRPPGGLPRPLRRVLLPLPAQLPEPLRALASWTGTSGPACSATCCPATLPAMHPDRLARSQDRLYEDLKGLGIRGITFTRNPMVSIPGIGPVEAPILAERGGQQWIIGVHGPLTRDVAPDAKLQEAKEFSTSVPVLLIDDTEITHNLPSASNRIIGALG